MFIKVKKRIVSLLLVFSFILAFFPTPVHAVPTFTNSIKNRFIDQIVFFAEWDFPYSYYAIHDFDDDGIPELLMGRNNREEDPLFIYYAVWKYDVVGDRFVYIGNIEESRYIMKDNYSNALIAVYADSTGETNCRAYFNYYITDNKVERNTMLTRLTTYGVFTHLVYDTMFIPSGYHRNDIPIDELTYYEEELNLLGSYYELIVHDWRAFNYESAFIAVNSWESHVVVKRPRTFSSMDGFTKLWQMPMYELIKEKLGPADTLIEDEYFWDYYLWLTYGQQVYQRFALHDFDGDSVPELLLGLQYGNHFSYDVYKWWNGSMRYIGSFDSYSKYLAVVEKSNDLFSFNPVPNEFYQKSARRIYMDNNTLNSKVLLASYVKNGQTSYYAPNSKNDALTTIKYNNFLNTLSGYVTGYREVRTFDINIVPPSAPLIMYIKTRGFTQ